MHSLSKRSCFLKELAIRAQLQECRDEQQSVKKFPPMSIRGCHCSYRYMGAQRRGCWSVSVLWQMALTARSMQRGRSKSAPARARPTCGCMRRVSAPWPAFIFRAQSYIGMIANVRLISLKRSRTDLNICEIERRQHEDTQVEKKKFHQTSILCVAACKVHMQLRVFLWHSEKDKDQRITLETTHTPVSTRSLTSDCTTYLVLHLAAFIVAIHHQMGRRISAQDSDENVMTNYTVTYNLKGTYQRHVAVKRIIELACMSLRLGCNAYL